MSRPAAELPPLRWRIARRRNAGGFALECGEGAVGGDAAIERAGEALGSGWAVAHPTSTVYGIGGRPGTGLEARIAALKGRPPGAMILLAADEATLRSELPGLRWTADAGRLASRFWPGPLTLVLDDGTDAGVAVRVDAHPAVLALLRRAGGLMTSTSLNRTGEPPPTTRVQAERAIRALEPGDARLGWLDAGDLTPSPPSTLFSLRGGGRRVLREGAVPSGDVVAALGAGP